MKDVNDLGVSSRRELAAALVDLTVDDWGREVWVDINDDHYVTARVVDDGDTRIGDFDCYGRVEHTDWRNDGRPPGFDGNAVKVQAGREQYWWQPPLFDKADRRRWAQDAAWRQALRSEVVELLEFGFAGLMVEVHTFCHSCRSHRETGSGALFGLEGFGWRDGYWAEVVDGLLAEAGMAEDMTCGGEA